MDEEIVLKPQFQNEHKIDGKNCRPILMEEFNGELICDISSSFTKHVKANVKLLDIYQNAGESRDR